MEIEKYLEKIKKEYLKTTPSRKFEELGLNKLLSSLPDREKRRPLAFIARRSVAFAVILIAAIAFGMFTIIQVAQAALPGEPLYPIKRLYEDLTLNKPFQKKEKVERRAQEIIDLVNKKKDGEALKETVRDYQETVDEVKKETSGKEESAFRKALQEHEEKFKDTIGNNPESKDEVEKAIESTRRGKEDEVKEEKTEENKSGENQEENEKQGKN